VFPPRDMADRLVSFAFSKYAILSDLLQVTTYFARYHFLMPILDKPSFLASYNHLMDNPASRTDPCFMSVVFAVFACASRLDPTFAEPDIAPDELVGVNYYERFVVRLGL
jgi:hypothetical protein